jgi:hypothetical protein
MTNLDILSLINLALNAYYSTMDTDNLIRDVSFDCDNNSGEIILTTKKDGKTQSWVISSSSIKEEA